MKKLDIGMADSFYKGGKCLPFSVLDLIQDLCFLIDENTNIVYINRAFLEAFSLSLDEVKGQPLINVMDKIGASISLSDKEDEIDFIFVDGRNIRFKKSLIKNLKGEFAWILGISYRISTPEKFEVPIKESELGYKYLVDTLDDFIFATDIEGNILFTNMAAKKFTGCFPEDLIGDNITHYIHPSDIKRVWEIIGTKIKKREKFFDDSGIECRLRKRDGTEIWVSARIKPIEDEKGSILGYSVIARDITRQKVSEEEKRRLVTAIEQSVEGIAITDEKGSITYWNSAFEHILKLSPEEIEGKFLKELLIQCKARFSDDIWDVINRGEVWQGRISIKGDDKTIELDSSISPIKNYLGSISNYVIVMKDVTHEMEIERQLSQAQKMEALGTLAGGIAHDFNNILAAIIGFSELILKDLQNQSPLYPHVKEIFSAGKRAKELVERILFVTKKTSHERKPVSLIPVIKEAIKLLRATIPSTIEIKQNLSEKIGLVMADASQIHQVIMNLCTNAAHAMNDTGGILELVTDEVTLSDVPTTTSSYARYNKKKKYFHLAVRDTGHGIPDKIKEKIFDPYFTTKESTEGGTGLGLATVKSIVESHDGFVVVESREGEGSTFHVYLPIYSSKSIDGINGEIREDLPLPTGKGRILLIDDEKMITESIGILLNRIGFKIKGFTNPLEAIKYFENEPYKFDMVITDQTMPYITGDKLARKILEIRKDIPVILCTGYSDHINEEKAKRIGIKAFFMKPINFRELAETVVKLINSGSLEER